MSTWMKQPGLYYGGVNPKGGESCAICDRCGQVRKHSDLAWQFDWQGTQIINLRILVCSKCYDTPNQQMRAIILPPDPVPIPNPRTRPTALYVTSYITDDDGQRIQDSDDQDIINSPMPD